ncbi:MAG: hypothetical protein ACKVHU_19080 [Acidimicrobiales bacterium]
MPGATAAAMEGAPIVPPIEACDPPWDAAGPAAFSPHVSQYPSDAKDPTQPDLVHEPPEAAAAANGGRLAEAAVTCFVPHVSQ